jgi:hypothetical protein
MPSSWFGSAAGLVLAHTTVTATSTTPPHCQTGPAIDRRQRLLNAIRPTNVVNSALLVRAAYRADKA